MTTLDVVFVKLPYGQEEKKTFTKRPLGMDFMQRMPMLITAVRSEAQDMGVQKGWVIKSIGGKTIEGMEFEAAYDLFKKAIVPLKADFLVRECPVEDVTVAALNAKVGPLEPQDVPSFLKRYGYAASSSSAWEQDAVRPEIALGVIDGHREKGIPVAHTWYALQGSFTPPPVSGEQASHCTKWQVERRLAHLRAMLHDAVKSELAKEYNEVFTNAHFAHHTGPPGTTNRLEAWLSAYSSLINSGKASPSLVALTLRFLEAPDLEEASAAKGGGPSVPGTRAAMTRLSDREPGSPQAPLADAPEGKDLDEMTDEGSNETPDVTTGDLAGTSPLSDQNHLSL